MKNFQMKNFQMKIKYFLQMKQFKAASKCKKQFHFQQIKAKNLFSCHIFETHAYTLWQAGCRAGWMGHAGWGRLVSGLTKSAIKISGNA